MSIRAGRRNDSVSGGRAAPSALSSGALTGLSLAVVSVAGAVAAALLSREAGKGPVTDGFFAGYGVYLVLVLVASAFRFVVLPGLTRAQERGALGGQLARSAVAFGVVAAPALVVALALSHPLAVALTHDRVAQESAAEALRWMLPAAVAQLYAGLLASALAARGSYRTAALGFAVGAVAAVVLFAALVDEHGPVALMWGLALNGAIAVAFPALHLAAARQLGQVAGWTSGVGREAVELARGVALPVAAQVLFVVGGRFASGLGAGEQTTFAYAYIVASVVVTVSAGALSLVSSAPLTRTGLDAAAAVRHVAAASWVSLVLVALTTALVWLVGPDVFGAALGGAYDGASGEQLAHVVVALTPWAIVAVAFSVAYPLTFVVGRTAWLPGLAAGVVLVDVPLAWAGREARGLVGLALGLAVATALLLAGVLALVAGRRLLEVGRALALAALVCGATGLVAFGLPRLVLGPWPAALLGTALYAGLFLLTRPRPLREAVAYLRGLGR